MTPTTTVSDRRTFSGNADSELDHPVDVLGRVRWAARLDGSAVHRAEDDSDDIGFRGHAAMFNSRTWIGGRNWGFFEQIAPGAFRKTIGEADVRFLINHDPNLVLARNRDAGTLRLTEDDNGLAVDADMAPTSYGRDLAISLERGDITQMSFAFEPIAWKREEIDEGDEIRTLITLTEVRLFDVAAVTYPAYADTDASLRSAAFAAMAGELGVDAGDILRQFSAGKPLGELLPDLSTGVSRSGTDADEETSEPPASTRDTDQPPTEGTDVPNPTQRALRQQMLRSRTNQIGI